MSNEAFERWHLEKYGWTAPDGDNFARADNYLRRLEGYEAGQASNAARIAELESDLKEVMADYQSLGAESSARIIELESDCKAMAEALIFTHVKKYVTHDPGFPPIRGCYCTCPTCLIAAKYRED